MQQLVSPWRKQFPALAALAGQNQVWLDSAATTQKPQAVLDALLDYYQQGAANVHRAQHRPGELATAAFEQARQQCANWLNVAAGSVVFTRSSTEGINLLSHSLAHLFQPGDSIVLGAHEHHANLLPWQQLALRNRLELRFIRLREDGALDLDMAAQLLQQGCKLLALSPLSNVMGRLHDVRPLLQLARQLNVLSLLDGAQYAVHTQPDLQQLGCDFFVCSSHKLFGPDGAGLLYVRPECSQLLRPWQWGGEMLEFCDYYSASARPLPLGLEAGTPSIANCIGFGAAINWLQQQDRQQIHRHEQALLRQLLDGLQQRQMQLLGEPDTALACFNAPGIHPADLSSLLAEQGVCVRGGQHCAMPLLQSLQLPGAVRVSLALYNDSTDLQRFFSALDSALEILQ